MGAQEEEATSDAEVDQDMGVGKPGIHREIEATHKYQIMSLKKSNIYSSQILAKRN